MEGKFNLNNLVRKNVADLKPYSSARDEYESAEQKMIFLDANENPNENGLNRYPDPQQGKLKQELAILKNTEPSRILLGNGSDEVLDLIFRAFCEPGRDNIITLPPTYGMYKVLAGINDIEERQVFLKGNFQPDTKQILNSVDKNTKLIFLCSPNNPTGNSFSEAAVREILIKFDGLVVIDEAYIDFSERESWLKELEKYPNLIITQTLSKAFGLAGIRLGICYASEEIIQVLNKIKPPYNVNELTQRKALERLLNYEEVEKQVAQILDQRVFLQEELKSINFVEEIYPSDANFLLVKVDDASKRYDQLLGRGVVIRNRTKEPLCENTLRFTVGTADENQKLIKVMKALQEETPANARQL